MLRVWNVAVRIIASVVLLAGGALQAAAQDPAAFYGGRTISILMGTSPGGSYDLYGRLIAQHMAPYIPGKPNIIIEHMPGAGGAIAGNYIFGNGPQDGSKILLSHALPLMEKLEDPKVIRYQSKKLQWLGAYDQIEQIMALWHTNGVSTIEDLKSKDMVVGSMGHHAANMMMEDNENVLEELIAGRCPLRYVGRARSSSPSEGSAAWHQLNQKALIEQAFDLNRTASEPSMVLSKQVRKLN